MFISVWVLPAFPLFFQLTAELIIKDVNINSGCAYNKTGHFSVTCLYNHRKFQETQFQLTLPWCTHNSQNTTNMRK